ncbi:MAG TPA: MarR family transcriptional regulator [Actinomycetota bacterium]|jgi:DNA-binding MarR family transcriptional regulator|nr:MarR family transcriptional regulator [Actinomycetota bacterium]
MPAVAPADTALAARLRLAVTRLARKLRKEAEPGITPTMLAAISSIGHAGRCTMGELCAAEQVQPPTMTRVVSAMVEAGLVAREPDAEDGRVTWVRLTPEGKRLLDRSRRRKEAYLVRALRGLEPRELAVLEEAAGILERLTEGRE